MNKKYKVFECLLKLIWSISPVYIVVLFLRAVFNGFMILINIFFTKYLLDELSTTRLINHLAFIVGIFVMGNMICTLVINLLKKYIDQKSSYVQEKVLESISTKIMNADYLYLEDSTYLNIKENAVFAIEIQHSLADFIDNLSKEINNIVVILELGAVITTLNVFFLLIILCIICIILYIEKWQAKRQLEFYKNIVPINRKLGYYEDLTFEDKMQREIRLYNMTDMISAKIENYNEEICKYMSKFYKRQGESLGIYEILIDLIVILAYGYTGISMISHANMNHLSIGDFTMYAAAAVNFSNAVISNGKTMIAMKKSFDLLQPFYDLMNIPASSDDSKNNDKIALKEINTIEFDQVSFQYPNCGEYVLNNISFKIKKGEQISIVGLNGAGKTTIIKLLCKLYSPTKGVIRINGIDINDYEYGSYNDSMSVVFQDFKLFPFTVIENISCLPPNENKEKVLEVLDILNMKDKVMELPNGVESIFGKEYDDEAIELSGGQSQKIAIARALYKNTSLIIMDEPTSALDPKSEMEIFENMKYLVKNKTSIFISHRMSSCTLSDKILVISNGLVEAFDSHANLIKNTEGTYYKLFNTQAVHYRN